jgi:outer membrane protein TolC
MKKITVLLLLLALTLKGFSQKGILEEYIRIGLENNLALQQKQAGFAKSHEALKEARGLFLPNVSLDARYTKAEGGRVIEIPVDQMLNPVYQNLNLINHQLYGNLFPDYPMLDPQYINFLRPTEHETKVRVVQPILNSQVLFNQRIKKELSNAERAELNRYKRQLIAEIEMAYYQYLQSLEYERLLVETERLVLENLRVNRKLIENDKITIDNVYRAETEFQKIKKLQINATKAKNLSRASFNFLLNFPLDSAISVDSTLFVTAPTYDLGQAQYSSLTHREELTMLKYYSQASNESIKLNRYNMLPTITGVIDYGYQGEKYQFSSDYDFFMASVVLKWDLFSGFQNKHKVEQSKIDRNILSLRTAELENQLNLEVMNAYFEVEAAYKEIAIAELEVNACKKTYDIVEKKYGIGQASMIEYVDARTNYTNAQHSLILSKYEYLIKKVGFEKAACLKEVNH